LKPKPTQTQTLLRPTSPQQQTARVLRKLLPGSKLRACLLNKATAAGSDLSKVDILIANPLRLRALVEEGKVDLSHVSARHRHAVVQMRGLL